jgi:hypothetical protein
LNTEDAEGIAKIAEEHPNPNPNSNLHPNLHPNLHLNPDLDRMALALAESRLLRPRHPREGGDPERPLLLAEAPG